MWIQQSMLINPCDFRIVPPKKNIYFGYPIYGPPKFPKKNCDHMDDDALEAPLAAAKWG